MSLRTLALKSKGTKWARNSHGSKVVAAIKSNTTRKGRREAANLIRQERWDDIAPLKREGFAW